MRIKSRAARASNGVPKEEEIDACPRRVNYDHLAKQLEAIELAPLPEEGDRHRANALGTGLGFMHNLALRETVSIRTRASGTQTTRAIGTYPIARENPNLVCDLVDKEETISCASVLLKIVTVHSPTLLRNKSHRLLAASFQIMLGTMGISEFKRPSVSNEIDEESIPSLTSPVIALAGNVRLTAADVSKPIPAGQRELPYPEFPIELTSPTADPKLRALGSFMREIHFLGLSLDAYGTNTPPGFDESQNLTK